MAIAITVARLVVCPASSSSTCSTITVFTTSSSSVRAIPLTALLLHYWGASLTPLFGTRPFTGGFWKQNACLVVFSRQFERLVVNQNTRKHPVWYQLPTSQENHHESKTPACGFADSRWYAISTIARKPYEYDHITECCRKCAKYGLDCHTYCKFGIFEPYLLQVW